MIILLNILFWASLALFGTLLIMPLSNGLSKLERTSLGMLIGAGLHSILYFIALKFSDSVFPSHYLFPIEITISFLVSRLARITPGNTSLHIKREHMLTSILGAIFGAMILSYTFLQATFWPVYEPDAIHLYDYRAQRLLQNEKNVLFSSLPYEHNSQYPPFTSLFHLFSYQNGLENPKILYPILYTAWYLCMIGYLLRTTKSPMLSIWGANIIIASPSIWWQSFQAMTNVPYTIYLTLGIMYLSNFSKFSYLLISSVVVAISMFIRTEPFWLIPLSITLIRTITKKNVVHTLWLANPFIVYMIWSTLHEVHVENSQLSSIIMPFLSNIDVISYFVTIRESFILTIKPVVVPILAMISTHYLARALKREHCSSVNTYYWSALLTVIIFFAGVINYSLRYYSSMTYHDSINRMSIIMIPPILISTILSIKTLIKSK